MKFITRKRLIIGSVSAVVITLIAILLSTIHFSFFKYTYVKNSKDLIEKVNREFYPIDNLEKIDLKDFSNSLVASYFFLDPSYYDETVDLTTLDDTRIIYLTYWFLTQNKKDVCIEKDYFLKMVNLYFGKDKIKWKLKMKNDGYAWFLKAYCFKQNEELTIPNITLENYNSTNNKSEFKYRVNMSEEEKEIEGLENKFYTVEFNNEAIPKLMKLNVTYEEMALDDEDMEVEDEE